jgi:hypothetical protein
MYFINHTSFCYSFIDPDFSGFRDFGISGFRERHNFAVDIAVDIADDIADDITVDIAVDIADDIAVDITVDIAVYFGNWEFGNFENRIFGSAFKLSLPLITRFVTHFSTLLTVYTISQLSSIYAYGRRHI